MPDEIEQDAGTQGLYQEVNERVAEPNSLFAVGIASVGRSSELIELVCECGLQKPCSARVHVTAATYERVRRDPTAYILLPEHAAAAVDDVIEQGDGFLIARNFGRAAEIARADNPRRLDIW